MKSQINKITSSDLIKRVEKEDVVLVDIRSPQEYQGEHIEGALNISPEQFENMSDQIGEDKAVVFYCRGGHRTSQVSGLLLSCGHKEVLVLEGGIMAWKAEGATTKKSTKAPIDLMRQVQVIAGSLVLFGVLLGVSFSPNYLLISAFVGLGLIFAGVSGFCGLARILSFMPWNKIEA